MFAQQHVALHSKRWKPNKYAWIQPTRVHANQANGEFRKRLKYHQVLAMLIVVAPLLEHHEALRNPNLNDKYAEATKQSAKV